MPRSLHRFCQQNTHSNSMNRCAQCATTRTEQIDHISSREHAWLKSWKAQDCTSLCPKKNCHRRVMSHSLSHLTLTTSTSSLLFTSPIFPTISPTHTRPLVHDPFYHAKSHGKVADQHKSHLSQISADKGGGACGPSTQARLSRLRSLH